MLGRLEVAGSRRRVGARVGNAGKRRRDRGEEHECEDNGTLHLVSLLSSLSFLMVATHVAFHTMCDEEILISPRADPILGRSVVALAKERAPGHPRSSDGAPASSQRWKSSEAAANRHSSSTSRAMARIAPIETATALVRQRPRSQVSKASGSGSYSTASARSWRLSDISMASGVVSRFL